MPPTPTPSPTPPVGDSFTYTGTLSQSDTYTYPSPSPFPSTSASASVALQVNVKESPAPFTTPAGGAYDVHYSEQDAFPNVTAVSTTDTFTAPDASGHLNEYGSVVTNGSGSTANTETRVYTTPYILDELPETNGANWTNSPAGTYTENEPDGNGITDTIAANGTYNETQTLAGGYNLTIAENADGSGTYGGTFLQAIGIQAFTFSAPSGGTVTVQAVFPSPSPPATPIPNVTVGTPPAWYGSSPTLYHETDTVTTAVTFPLACNVNASIGTSGNRIARTITSTDTILGYVDNQIYTEYTVPATGAVACIVMTDVQTYYYDYLDDTQASYGNYADFAGTVQQTATTLETVGLQSETLASLGRTMPQTSTRSTLGASSARGLSAEQLAVATARFQARIEAQRFARELKFLQRLERITGRRVPGGVL
jgi:hypothetical protein